MVLTAERGLVPPVLTILMALNVCQFNAAEAATLVKECFPNFEAFLRMKEKDISSVADDYSKRTNAQSRIIFGFYRTNELKGLMYWVQDMKRMSKDPESQVLTSDDIQLAMDNTDIRKNLSDNMETSSKAADPGKLGNSIDWYTWSRGFVNYLSTIPGSTGIPLSYVVRELDEPIDLIDNDDYLTTLVSRAPLKGTAYVADRRQVHQLLTGKVLGEHAEEWIRDDKNKQNGRVDYHNLRLHFEGEGNVSRRITQAEAIYKTLHYRQERSMKFSAFLGRMQVMFQIYKQEKEEFQESAKIRFLLDRVQAPNLQAAVTSLQFQHTMGTLTYATAKNSLMSTLARSPDYMQNEGRNIAATTMGMNYKSKTRFPKYGGQKGVMHKVKSKFNFGKKIPTGEHYIDRVTWRGLTKEQRESIQRYREKIGFKGSSKSVISEITTLSNPLSLSNKDIHRIAEAIGDGKGSTSTIGSASAGKAFGGKSEAILKKTL